jgi:hypothetical protein
MPLNATAQAECIIQTATRRRFNGVRNVLAKGHGSLPTRCLGLRGRRCRFGAVACRGRAGARLAAVFARVVRKMMSHRSLRRRFRERYLIRDRGRDLW